MLVQLVFIALIFTVILNCCCGMMTFQYIFQIYTRISDDTKHCHTICEQKISRSVHIIELRWLEEFSGLLVEVSKAQNLKSQDNQECDQDEIVRNW